MNRADFQKLAALRLNEAKALLDNKCYEGAYYLIGYAVECGLKVVYRKTDSAIRFSDQGCTVIEDSYIYRLT